MLNVLIQSYANTKQLWPRVKNMSVIEAQNVSKSYGKVKALNDFSLKVPKGSLFALIGPNGAGKTTFIRCLLGLTQQDTGRITINEINTFFDHSRKSISYLPEKFNFYPYYTIESALAFFGKMQGVSSKDLAKKVDEVLNLLGISELGNRKLKNLSKGQLQRLGLAQLFLSNSQTLILDEPFSGLDPIGIKELKDILKKCKQEGRTIFLNTHILSEVEQLCDYVGILNHGQLVAQGPINEVKRATGSLEQTFYDMISNKSGK